MPAPPGGLTVGDETAAVDAGRLTSGGATLPGAGARHQSGPGDGRTARSKNFRRSIDTGRTVLTPADPTAYTSGLARAPPSESSSSLGRSATEPEQPSPVKGRLPDWTLYRVVWVADRGFASARNRCYLRSGDHHYIIGEKLRSGSAEAGAALSRQGRYQDVEQNLRVKEVRIAEDERFVICFNPRSRAADAAVRERMPAQLSELMASTDALNATKRAELRGVISTKPGLNRYLRVTPGGLLRIDASAIKAEENLDGKYLLRTSDPKLSAEDIALGYNQLPEVERGWRDLKQVIDLRPVYHRKRRAHPRPRHLVLARPAADPDRRNHHQHHLGQDRRRAGPAHPRHLHRPPGRDRLSGGRSR